MCCFVLAYKIETNKNYEATTAIRLWLLLLFNEQGNCSMELADLNKLESAILVAISWKLMTPNTDTFTHSILQAFPCQSEVFQLSELINESFLADVDYFERFPSSLLAISSVTLANLLVNKTYIVWEHSVSGYTFEKIQHCILTIRDLFKSINISSCEAIIQHERIFGSPVSNVANASKDAHVTPEINEDKISIDLTVSPVKTNLPRYPYAPLVPSKSRIYQLKSRSNVLNNIYERYLVSHAYCTEDAMLLLNKIHQL